jgi:uncharacterized protein (TIGR03663 family)
LAERDPFRPGWLFWLAFAAALAVRLACLGIRPLHHDEGVNAWFLNNLLEGRGYQYNPDAFHGPFLYLFGWLPAWILGVSSVALRLPVALTSAGTLLLLLPLRRRLGRAGMTGAAWLMALSPSLVFYGRDLIHESYLVFLSLALVAAGSHWLETRRRRDLLLAAAALALLFTVKETAPLTLAGLGLASLTLRSTLGSPRQQHTLWPGKRDALLAAAVFAAIYVLFFTTLFSNPMGLVDSVRAYLPWAEKGVEGGTGHEKPWTYFPDLLQAFEATAVLCALGGGVLAFRLRDPFGRFCAVWAASQVVAYSLIPYKTPWLILNMVVPAALTAGVLFREAAARPLSLPARGALTAVLVLGLGWSAWRAADLSFRRYDDGSLGLVYADTNRQVWDLLAFVRAAARRAPHPTGVSLAAFFTGRWPLPWYLRDLRHSRWDQKVEKLPTEDIILADPQQEASLQPLEARGYRHRQFLLRPGVFVSVWVRRGLWPDPPHRVD